MKIRICVSRCLILWRTWRRATKEALRAVKKKGTLAFQGLFPIKRIYGEIDDSLETMKSCDIKEIYFVDTSNSSFVPKLLKLPLMIGKIGIICGTK